MNKKTIIIFVNILIAGALFFVVADPLWNSIKEIKVDIEEKSKEVAETENLLAKVSELEKEYQEMGEDSIGEIAEALPQEKDLPYLMNQFETIAINNGLLLESISFGSEILGRESESQNTSSNEPASPFPYLSVDIALTGSYEGFKTYLEALEDNLRLMDVKTISFSGGGSDDGSDLESTFFEFSLSLFVYYQ